MIRVTGRRVNIKIVVTFMLGIFAIGWFGIGHASASPTDQVSPASKSVLDQITRGSAQPAKCYAAYIADSNKSWAVLMDAYPTPSKCHPFDGWGIQTKRGGKWRLAFGGSHFTCPDFKRNLIVAGAPLSVYKDFKASGFCY